VLLTEVTDPAVKHRVVIAWAAERTTVTPVATGEHKDRKPAPFLVGIGLVRSRAVPGR